MNATDRFTCGGSSPIWPTGRRTRPQGNGSTWLVQLVVVLGLLLYAVAGWAQAPAERTLIADVIPQVIPPESQTVPNQKIMSLIKTRANAEYQAEVVKEDVRRLYETKLFADIRVLTKPTEDNRINVIFQLKELPGIVQEVIYKGANHLKQDELEALTGLKKGLPLNPWATQKARQAILDKYKEKGRLSASVDILEGDKIGDRRIVFNITEGPVARVNRVDFVGNHFVTQGRLRTQIKSSRPFLGLIGGEFNPLVADNDVNLLEEYYKSFGFHDVRVRRELQWDESQRHVRLIFHIKEGKQYRISAFEVTGVSPEKRQELLPLITDIHKGDIYNQHKIETDQNKMKDWIGYKGQEASIQPVVYYPPDQPGQVLVQYAVHERPPARVGQILIAGNEVTRQNVILRQVPLYPGQILTYPDLRVAERNLAKLNIFETNPEKGIRPTVTVLDNNDDTEFKDVLVQVKETQTGSFLLGLGVNSDAGLTGSIVLNERNFDLFRPPTSLDDFFSGRAFRGAGQEFRIEAVPGTQLQRYTVNFREPFLFDSLYSLSVGGYYYDRVYNEDRESRLGGRITIGRQLNKYWSASAGIRIENVGIHDVSVFAPYDYQAVVGNNFLLGLRAGVTRDSRDSYLRPTEGSHLEFSFEQVLGEFTFPVVNVEGTKYFTVYQRPDGSGRQVLAARTQLAYAGSNAPVYERFYAGGFQSMRGFEFRGVSPDINGFKVGGDFMFLNSVEYQIPLLANDMMYVVGFVDSGTVEPTVEFRDYRVSAGVGLRIVVPMLGPVPIALDFGFPIVKASTDRTQVFSFWVGFFH
jgi:outer membrane protein assembly complex protein YaeT